MGTLDMSSRLKNLLYAKEGTFVHEVNIAANNHALNFTYAKEITNFSIDESDDDSCDSESSSSSSISVLNMTKIHDDLYTDLKVDSKIIKQTLSILNGNPYESQDNDVKQITLNGTNRNKYHLKPIYKNVLEIYKKDQGKYLTKTYIPLIYNIMINSYVEMKHDRKSILSHLSTCYFMDMCSNNARSIHVPKSKSRRLSLNLDFISLVRLFDVHIALNVGLQVNNDFRAINSRVALMCIEEGISTTNLDEYLLLHTNFSNDTRAIDYQGFFRSVRIIADHIKKLDCMCSYCDPELYDTDMITGIFTVLDRIYDPVFKHNYHTCFLNRMNLDLLSSIVSITLEYNSIKILKSTNLPSENNLLQSYCTHLFLTSLLDSKEIEFRCLSLKLSMSELSIYKKERNVQRRTILCKMFSDKYEISFPEYNYDILSLFEIPNLDIFDNIPKEESAKNLEPEIDIMCQVCFSEKSETHLTFDCKHEMCSECLSRYVKEEIDNGMIPIKCLTCKNSDSPYILPEHVIKRYISNDLIESMHARSLAIATSDQNFRHCSGLNCKFKVELQEAVGPYWMCSLCKTLNCSKCRSSHKYVAGVPCPKDPLEDQIKCPFCGVNVSKIDGCNHITCKCKRHFCYICGKGYKNNGMSLAAECKCPLFNPVSSRDSD